MHIAIMGTGAMACLFGARLAPHADVILIGTWAQQIETLNRGGLRIHEPDGSVTQHTLRAISSGMDASPADVAILLTKAPGTARAARDAANALAPDGIVLNLQNGIGHEAVLREYLDLDRVTAGIAFEGAWVPGPGEIVYAGGYGITVGMTSATRDKLDALAPLLDAGGIPCELVEDVRGAVWGKLAVNAGINAVTALTGFRNAEVMEHREALAVADDAARETQAVAKRMGIELPYPDAAEQMHKVVAGTPENQTSMLQDMLRGVPTEVDVINGAVVDYGKRVGVPTPVNLTLTRLIKTREQQNRVGQSV